MTYNAPVYIVDGARTPFLKARGKPGPFSPVDLAVGAGAPLLMRQKFPVDAIDQVVLGCAAPLAEELNPARVAALRLGLPERVPGWTVQRQCGSGMQSIVTAARAVVDGESDIVLAGGAESMSRSPLQYNLAAVNWFADLSRSKGGMAKLRTLARWRPQMFQPVIAILWGLRDPVADMSMGETAEKVAERFAIAREAMDAFALESHQRVTRAQKDGTFDGEIEPLFDAQGRVYDADDGVRHEQTMEQLGKLKPVFEKFGTVTAGNSSQVTDGASWVIVASEKAVEKYDLPVLGRVRDSQWAGLDPAQMGLGPVYASTPVLERNGLGLNDPDVWEINEAFAAQVLGVLAAWNDPEFNARELERQQVLGQLDQQKLNIDGGAIALGHPVGASGNRIVLHALHALKQRGGKTAVASLCMGGGQGGAVLLQAA